MIHCGAKAAGNCCIGVTLDDDETEVEAAGRVATFPALPSSLANAGVPPSVGTVAALARVTTVTVRTSARGIEDLGIAHSLDGVF